MSKDSEGKLQCRAIFSRIVSLFAEQNDLQFAVPGGLIGKKNKKVFTLCYMIGTTDDSEFLKKAKDGEFWLGLCSN